MKETQAKSEFTRALERITRYLALRDHSRHELRQKLSRNFTPDVVHRVISEAEERGWITSEEEIAERTALALARRFKSRAYIEAQLRKRRLPVPPRSETGEAEKARALVGRKFGKHKGFSFEERAKVFRFLKYRGFDDRAIRQVMNEEP